MKQMKKAGTSNNVKRLLLECESLQKPPVAPEEGHSDGAEKAPTGTCLIMGRGYTVHVLAPLSL